MLHFAQAGLKTKKRTQVFWGRQERTRPTRDAPPQRPPGWRLGGSEAVVGRDGIEPATLRFPEVGRIGHVRSSQLQVNGQIARSAMLDVEEITAEGHRHRSMAPGGGQPAAVLAGRLGGALSDRLRIADGRAKVMAWKTLRSDGQVVPSSRVAALMLPSRSASWKARSAPARSPRNRLGCQRTRCWACKDTLVGRRRGFASIRRWV